MEQTGTNDLTMILTFVVLFGGLLLLQIAYLITLYKLLSRIAPENRTLTPGLVFLQLIPLWWYVWRFIMVNRISESLGNELRARGIHNEDPTPGRSQGLWYSGLYLGATFIPFAGLAALILWVMYWVKMNEFQKRLGPATPDTGTLDQPPRYLK